MDHSDKVGRWQQQRTILARQIHACLTKGTPPDFNLSIPRHSITAPVLRRFAYDEAFRGRSIPVVFQDTSKSEPFPIGCLTANQSAPKTGEVVKLGLSSFRHPDLEYLIDLYFARNRDLNDESSMAGVEALTCRRAVEMLSDPALRDGGQVWVFHTGLEPMVVGFYRGVVTVLQERKRRGLPRTLVITPWLYALDHSDTKNIGPETPGAKLESYVQADPWW